MRVMHVCLVGALALAGCVTPAATPRAEDLPSALPGVEIDLQQALLAVPIDPAEPTLVVALRITRDMWIRPHTTGPTGEGIPVEQADHWVLCPWMRTSGLPEGSRYLVVPFWLEGSVLRPAMRLLVHARDADADATSGTCATRIDTIPTTEATASSHLDVRDVAITAVDPFDATLVLIVSPAIAPQDPGELLVGVAVEKCPDSEVEPCPPGSSLAARAVQQARGSSWAACGRGAEFERFGCVGFDVQEALPPVAGAQAGRVVLSNTSLTEVALRIGSATLIGVGENRLAYIQEDGQRGAACQTRGFSLGRMMRVGAGATDFVVSFDLAAGASVLAQAVEIPLDVRAVGWTIEEPPAAFSGSVGGCLGSGLPAHPHGVAPATIPKVMRASHKG